MKREIRILHVIGSSRFGGATGVVFSLANMAREHGLAVDILTSNPDTLEHCRRRGLGVLPFAGIPRAIRPHKDFLDAVRLTRLLRDRYELVHTHTTKGGAVGRLAAHWAKVPAVVHTVHGFAFHEFSSRLATWLGAAVERRLARWCDRIIFVNHFDCQRAEELGIGRPEQRITIYNGISESVLARGRNVSRRELLTELHLPDEALLCVFVGRLAPQKGLTYLLEAMATVQSHLDRPMHLALVGRGESQEQLTRQAASLGLADRVHFLGFRDDGIRWTGGADVFVLPSLWEGHSISLLEAMGLARPIVASDIKGNRESITHGRDGLLTPPRDPQALAQAIVQLGKDPALARSLGTAAKAAFDARFTEERMKRQTWELYRDLLVAKGLLESQA